MNAELVQRSEVPADLEQLGPVLGVAREPGGFEAQDDADMAQGDFGRHVLEAGPLGKAAGRDAEVVQDSDGIAPAEGAGLVAEADLDAGALGVVTHLLGAGLADVDDGRSRQMIGGDAGENGFAPGLAIGEPILGDSVEAGLRHRHPHLPQLRRPPAPPRRLPWPEAA